MEAPVEKKASVWETLRSKNPLLFAIILVVIAGSCNYLGTGFLTPALSGVQDENDDDKAIEATKTANTPTPASTAAATTK